MKREEWQGVYAPRGDALDRRVQQALIFPFRLTAELP